LAFLIPKNRTKQEEDNIDICGKFIISLPLLLKAPESIHSLAGKQGFLFLFFQQKRSIKIKAI